MEIIHVIYIQVPILLILVSLIYAQYRIVGLAEFIYFLGGWVLNLAYVGLTLALWNHKDNWMAEAGISLLNAASTFLFLLMIRYNSIGLRLPKLLMKMNIPVMTGIIILVELIKLIPLDNSTDRIPGINATYIPSAVLDTLVLLMIAFYMYELAKKYKITPVAAMGFGLYALVQWLSIFSDGVALTGIAVTKIGFMVGAVAKVMIILGLINFFPSLKEIELKKQIAAKLDDIFGKTFHEIRYPLKEMNIDLEKLLPSDDENGVTNKNEIMAYVRKIDSAFHHLAAIVGASYKLYETDIGKPMENDNTLIAIPGDKQETISINPIIQIAILKIKPLTDDNIDFHCEYASNCFIDCHSYLMVQVFLNLFNNSREAFGERNGKISIKTRVRKMEVEGTVQKYVEVTVEDSGPGISDEYLPDIFTQGFSTKTQKHGRGFGLAIVKQVVENSKGTIELVKQENPGSKGACFVLTFPQAKIFPKRS